MSGLPLEKDGKKYIIKKSKLLDWVEIMEKLEEERKEQAKKDLLKSLIITFIVIIIAIFFALKSIK